MTGDCFDPEWFTPEEGFDSPLTPQELAGMLGEILALPAERVSRIHENTEEMLRLDMADMEKETMAQLSWLPTTWEGDVR